MTLETARKLVLEQGEYADKEAQAVVRGGMTICEQSADGHRTYLWIKVIPTKTDAESSIEQALEVRQAKITASNKKKQLWKDNVTAPVKTPETAPVPITKEEALKTLETKDAKYKLEYISDLVDIQEIRVAVPLMENPEMIIKTSSLSDEAKDKIMSLDDKRYIRIRKESGSVYISVPIFGVGFNYKFQDGFNPYEYEDSRKDK